MFDVWVAKLSLLIVILLMAAITALAVYAFRRMTWWPSLFLQVPVRPWTVLSALFVILFGITLLTILCLPAGVDVCVTLLSWLTIAPGLADMLARQIAWSRDTVSDRAGAARIRKSILERRGETVTFDESRPWPSYIVDIARLNRRRKYNPPGL